jgi:LysM repeat protein
MMRALRYSAVVALALLAVAEAGAQSLAERLDVARVVARAEVALAQDEALRPFRLRARLDQGAVVLTGRVATAAQRERAEAVLRGVDGIGRVDNRIEVDTSAQRSAGPLPPRLRPAPAEPPPAAAQAAGEPRQAASEPEAVYHTVRSGDTLFALSRRYGVSVAEIQRRNNLRGTNLRPGQRLRIR